MADRRRIFALTVLQPWAELIVRGPKRVENRTWEPRGLRVGDYLAIHAGKRVDLDHWEGAATMALGLDLPLVSAYDDAAAEGTKGARAHAAGAVPYGAVVGVARLAGVERAAPDGDPWWSGPVGWRLDNVVAVDPIPCAGAQGLWPLPPDVLSTLRARWKEIGHG